MSSAQAIRFIACAFLLVTLNSCLINVGKTSSEYTAEQLRPLLNSERIELIFGSYGIDVLESNSSIRVSSLYSQRDHQKKTRTFSVVQYPAVIDPLFSAEHDAILAGQSIGLVFKQNGWTIDKRNQYFGLLDANDNYSRAYALFGNIAHAKLAIHIYGFYIQKDDAEFLYATIAEVHHPDYLSLKDLQEIYQQGFDQHTTKTDPVLILLETVKNKMKRQS